IADGWDRLDRRAHPLVDLDEAVGMRGHADLLEADVLRPRPATHRHQELPRPDLALLGVDADAVARLLGALDLDPDPAVDARLLERAEHLLRDVLVLERHKPIQTLE